MGDTSKSDTPLKATFKVRLNGETVTLATVGQAYRFISNLSAQVALICLGKRMR